MSATSGSRRVGTGCTRGRCPGPSISASGRGRARSCRGRRRGSASRPPTTARSRWPRTRIPSERVTARHRAASPRYRARTSSRWVDRIDNRRHRRCGVRVAAGTMEFRVLGPVEMWAGERECTGTWVRPRALLAALLLELNATVPVERLATAVWDDRPPRTVRNSLQALVSQVRRTLDAAGADAGDVTLRTEPGGYRLWADQGLVDVCRFRVNAAAFRAAAAAGDRRRAISRGRDALREWRGVALAGLAGGWAARAREGMAREHVELLSQYFEVRLNDGEHT